MLSKSTIEATLTSWNPLTGCTKISPGCKHCYAERMARRLQGTGVPKYANGFALTLHEDLLELPLGWKKPRRVFVNSMSDLFHKDVPLEFIQRVFAIMSRADWHQFQVLTKRSDRLAELSPLLPWAPNIWAGVTVESQAYTYRIDHLRHSPAKLKWLSVEPLLGLLRDLDLHGIDWVTVGGESGPGARPMEAAWVLDIRDQCRQAGVPFFFKQWAGRTERKQVASSTVRSGRRCLPSPSARAHCSIDLELSGRGTG